jgi:hypothetical protein
MNTTTVIPAVTDYLVTAAAGAAGMTGVRVFDGPQPAKATQALEQVLWIGCDPANLTDVTGEAVQDWPVMDSGRTKDEDGSIVCAAQHWSGSSVIKTHRDGANAIVAAVELLLRGTPASGGPGDASMGGLVLWSGVNGPYQWYPKQAPDGAAVLVVFRIVYRARLVIS